MERDIVGSHRDNNLRLGFHFYNNDDDIEAVIAALTDLRTAFRDASRSTF
jgi:selenocysteine lyase/cysteine desulfurase